LASPSRQARSLIVNADDFGLSRGVTEGILEAHERGIVTSTSLMVRQPSAPYAVRRVGASPRLSIGLHADLGEWAFRSGSWVPVYHVVTVNDAPAVEAELRDQVETFVALVGRNPTHLDSHQHVHSREPSRSVFVSIARELGIPLRHATDGIRYCGRFYGQTDDGTSLPDSLTVESLLAIIAGLEPGTTELACHPGYAAELDTMYREERAAEVAVLCDPRVREAISAAGIELKSFAEYSASPIC
jgi:chitin disaccharide deacetylase